MYGSSSEEAHGRAQEARQRGKGRLAGRDGPQDGKEVFDKYLTVGKLPSELNEPRTWRTREDPFATVWPGVRLQLEINPALTAKRLMTSLQQKHPGTFTDGQLRTLQRRVREWRREQLYARELATRMGREGTIDAGSVPRSDF